MSADSWILSRRTIGQTAYRELEYGHTHAYLTGPNLGTFRSCGLGGPEREFDLYTGAEVPLTQQPGVRRLMDLRGTGCIARVWDESTQKVILEIPEVGDHFGSTAVLSPGGKWLALLVRDPETVQRESDADMESHFYHELALYDVESQRCVESLPLLHNYGIFLKFSPDETMLSITGEWNTRFDGDEPPLEGLDSLAVLWDLERFEEIRCMNLQSECHEFLPTMRAVLEWHYCRNEPLAIHDLATGTQTREIPLPEGFGPGFVAVSPNERQVVMASDRGEVVRVSLETFAVLDRTRPPYRAAEIHRPQTLGVQFDNHEVRILQRSQQALYFWSAPSGRLLSATMGHSSPPLALAYSAAGDELWSVSRESSPLRWSPEGQLLGEVTLAEETYNRIIAEPLLLPTGWLLNAASLPLCVRLPSGEDQSGPWDRWDRRNWFHFLPQTPLDRTWLPRVFRTGHEEPADLTMHDLQTHQVRPLAEIPPGEVTGCGCGDRVLIVHEAEGNRTLTAFDANTGTVLWTQTHSQDRDGDLSSWDIAGAYPEFSSRRSEMRLSYPTESRIVPAPDGASAVVFPTDAGRLPFVIDAATGQRQVTWSLPVMPHIAIHPAGRLVAATIAHGEPLLLLDYHTGEHLATLLDRGGATALAWNPAGTHLAVGRFDTTIEVLEIDLQHATAR